MGSELIFIPGAFLTYMLSHFDWAESWCLVIGSQQSWVSFFSKIYVFVLRFEITELIKIGHYHTLIFNKPFTS